MKKAFFIPVLCITCCLFLFAFSQIPIIEMTYHKSPLQSNGPAGGKSGAPGEQNCTACHSGPAQDGTTENTLLVLDANNQPALTYVPGSSYTVNLVMASNPAKKGFQATVLSSSNAMAGSFTSDVTTQIVNATISGAQRNYAEHKASSNTSATQAWTWSWTAPSTNVGNLTFYVASNKANNNGNPQGDVIYLSQHIINAPSSGASLAENAVVSAISMFYSAESESIIMTFEALQQGVVSLNIVDLNGKIITLKQNEQVIIGQNKHAFKLPSRNLNSGTYILQALINGKQYTKSIIVN